MKIRINKQTLQFRLSNQDLQTLEKNQRLESNLEINSALTWYFSLAISETVRSETLNAESNRLELQLPNDAFKTWNLSHEIEWEVSTEGSNLRFVIEKDLKDTRHS